MTKKKNSFEKRKHKRFRVHEDAFVVLKPDYTRLGHLADISMGGLAFSYVDEKVPSGRSSELEIFFLDNRFHLDNVSCETTSDFETGSLIGFRRCSVRFRELTDNQKSQLNDFIKDYATGGV